MEQYYQDNRNYGTGTCGAARRCTSTSRTACVLTAAGQGYTATATGTGGRVNGPPHCLHHQRVPTRAPPRRSRPVWAPTTDAGFLLRDAQGPRADHETHLSRILDPGGDGGSRHHRGPAVDRGAELASTHQNLQIRSAAEQIAAGMHMPRTRRIRRNAQITLTLSNNTAWVVTDDNNVVLQKRDSNEGSVNVTSVIAPAGTAA